MDASIDVVRRIIPETRTDFLVGPQADFLLLVDGISFLLYVDGISQIILVAT